MKEMNLNARQFDEAPEPRRNDGKDWREDYRRLVRSRIFEDSRPYASRDLNKMDDEHTDEVGLLLRELAESEHRYMREWAAGNKFTPAEMLSGLAEDEYWEIRRKVAFNVHTPVNILTKLAEDRFHDVREGVAANPGTPVDSLMKLTEDESRNVRAAVARNPNAPADILTKLAEDNDWWIRGIVARNPTTPVETLTKLAEDKVTDVREAIAKNPNIPIETLLMLAKDDDWEVRAAVAENSNTPAEMFTKLAEDKAQKVRGAVARNPNTSAELLAELAGDEEGWVRRGVAENPNASAETLARVEKADALAELSRNGSIVGNLGNLLIAPAQRFHDGNFDDYVISSKAFSGRDDIRSVRFAGRFTGIGQNAFFNCVNLTEIELPDTLKRIGIAAFCNTALRELHLPASLVDIEGTPLEGCGELRRITVDPDNPVYKSEGDCCLTKDGKTLLFGCSSSVIPDGVETIASFAFSRCTGMTSMKVPSGVKRIGYCAFDDCRELGHIELPSGLERLGNGEDFFIEMPWPGLKKVVLDVSVEGDFAMAERVIASVGGDRTVLRCKDTETEAECRRRFEEAEIIVTEN